MQESMFPLSFFRKTADNNLSDAYFFGEVGMVLEVTNVVATPTALASLYALPLLLSHTHVGQRKKATLERE